MIRRKKELQVDFFGYENSKCSVCEKLWRCFAWKP